MMGRKTTLAIANLFAGSILGLIALKLTALYFGRAAFGQFEFALSLLGILFLLADLNMSDAHVKRVSEGMDAGDCFATFAVFRTVATSFFVFGTLAGLYAYAGILGKPLISTTVPVIVFVLIYYVGKSAAAVAQSTFEARAETALSQIGSLLETILRVLLTVVFAYVFAAMAFGGGPLAGRVDPDNAFWRWIRDEPGAAIAVTFAVGAVLNAAVSIRLVLRSHEGGRFRWDILRSYLTFALPLFMLSAVSVIGGYVDRVALGFFASDTDTGDFGGLRRVVMIIEGIGVSVSFLLFPAMSALAAQGDTGGIRRILRRSERYLSLLIVPMTAFLVAFPGPVISLILDDEWLGNVWTLSVLAVWVLIITLARPYVNLLMGTNQPRVTMRIGIFTSVLNIVLNLILIPDDIQSLGIRLFGLKALGAAIATLVSGIVYYALIRYATRELVGPGGRWSIPLHLLAATVMVGALQLAHQSVLPLARWYSFALYVPLGLVVYVATLVVVRELRREDWVWLLETVNPRAMIRYLRAELFNKQT